MCIKTFLKLLVAVAISESAGIIGSIFTISAIPTWYASLQKPVFNPPNWIFGPVWTTLYLLMGIAAFLMWTRKDATSAQQKNALTVFGFQLLLNTLWSFVFFGTHSLFAALIIIVALWATILWTIVVFYRISRPATYLLIPYILWVTFACYLNYAIWTLN